MSLRPSPAARRRARERLREPGRAEWKADPPPGRCEGCGRRGRRMRHHVVREQDVRRYGGDPWDQANAMLLGRYCDCHERHHWPSGNGRLPARKIPRAAVDFAVRLMGDDLARAYLARWYAG